MRLMVPLILASAVAAVQAQVAAPLGPTAQILERRLREYKGSLLVVVDGPKGEWKAKVDAAMASVEWLDLDLRVAYYGAKATEVEVLLRQKYQAGPRPQWVLVGEGGRAVAMGGTVPDAKEMGKAIAESGIRSEHQLLKQFVRAHPEHLEARTSLCSALLNKASRKTLIRFGGKVDPLRPVDEPFDFAKNQKEQDEKAEAKEQLEEKAPAQLGPEEDLAIWGELADLLGKSFRSGDWIEMQAWVIAPSETAVHSPLMQDMSRAAVLDVERALERNPGSWERWQLWLGLTRTFGGKPIRPLLDSLVPLPNLPSNQWPPYLVRDAYVKDARKRKDWVGIRDLLLPQVESMRLGEEARGPFSIAYKMDGKVQEFPETGDFWRTTLEPLAEALLRLGDMGQADELVRDRFAKHPWAGLPKRAEALAQRCGQPGLAAAWAALGSGK